MYDKHLRGTTADLGLKVPMRDGIVLLADLYRPSGAGRHPVLLMRTPYGRQSAQSYWYAHPAYYASRGYAVLVQDCRGRGDSGGDFEPLVNEPVDAVDTLEWIARQPWSNGSVGTYGYSYLGVAQLAAAAAVPGLIKAMVPALAPCEMREGCLYRGGAFALGFALGWAMELGLERLRRRGGSQEELLEAIQAPCRQFRHRPLADQPLMRRSHPAPFYFDWLAHETDPDYWAARSLEPLYANITTPALHVGGWYDIFVDGTARNYQGIAHEHGTPGQRLVIGPWHHIPGLLGPGEQTTGVNPKLIDDWQLRWFDRWLREDGPAEESPVKVYCIGAQRWMDFASWPPPGADEVRLYLRSQGRANSAYGDGRLDHEEPGEEPPDIFVYNPVAPVLSAGGQSCCWPSVAPMGAHDQTLVEASNDLLIYTSVPMTRDLLVAGDVRVELYATTSACDTDWVARLCDVDDEGRSLNVKEGIIRARFRNGARPELLQPGQVQRYEIRIGNICRLFRKGHRLRVQITSSSFPTWEPNPNTGRPLGTDRLSQMVVATQMVLHERRAPSAIVLPVVDGAEGLIS